MSMEPDVANTPYYVLLNEDGPIGPKLPQQNAAANCVAIYGFSQKQAYDSFSKIAQQALKPYPLVEGYLRDQIGDSDGCLKLVVLDAIGPCEPVLKATPMEVVLQAQNGKLTEVAATHCLLLDEQSSVYRLRSDCPGDASRSAGDSQAGAETNRQP